MEREKGQEVKLIIAGGRDYFPRHGDGQMIRRVVDQLGVVEIVSGCANGADEIGEIFSFGMGKEPKRFPAEWGEWGKAAGPIRNKQMADYGDVLLVFPGNSGTVNMIEQAKKKGMRIYSASLDRFLVY
jgi:hypothetical protein